MVVVLSLGGGQHSGCNVSYCYSDQDETPQTSGHSLGRLPHVLGPLMTLRSPPHLPLAELLLLYVDPARAYLTGQSRCKQQPSPSERPIGKQLALLVRQGPVISIVPKFCSSPNNYPTAEYESGQNGTPYGPSARGTVRLPRYLHRSTSLNLEAGPFYGLV